MNGLEPQAEGRTEGGLMLLSAVVADLVAGALLIVANVSSSFDFQAVLTLPFVLIIAAILWGIYVVTAKIPVLAKVACLVLLLSFHVLPALFVFMMLGTPIGGGGH